MFINSHDFDVGVFGKCCFRYFRQLREDEQDSDSDAKTCDRQVYVLDVGEIVSVGSSEEELRGDEGADERGYSVPGLAELKTDGGGCWVADDNCVGIGRCFQRGEPASNDEGADEKAAVGGKSVGGSREVGSGPEEDCAERVERQSHENCGLVSAALEDFGCNWREEEISLVRVNF